MYRSYPLLPPWELRAASQTLSLLNHRPYTCLVNTTDPHLIYFSQFLCPASKTARCDPFLPTNPLSRRSPPLTDVIAFINHTTTPTSLFTLPPIHSLYSAHTTFISALLPYQFAPLSKIYPFLYSPHLLSLSLINEQKTLSSFLFCSACHTYILLIPHHLVQFKLNKFKLNEFKLIHLYKCKQFKLYHSSNAQSLTITISSYQSTIIDQRCRDTLDFTRL